MRQQPCVKGIIPSPLMRDFWRYAADAGSAPQ
jgi:hypothetical protein